MSRLQEAIRETRQKNLKDGQKAIDVAKEASEEAAENPKQVVFYAWVDGGNQSQPSSVTMRISGGERARDSESGRIAIATPYVEIRFNMGILRTDNPDVIREVRKMIAKGDTITEDQELYLEKIEKPELRALRLGRKNAANADTVRRQADEIEQLKAKLAAVGAPA